MAILLKSFLGKFIRVATGIVLILILVLNYKLEMRNLVEEFQRQSDDSYKKIEKKISITNEYLNILSNFGTIYYKNNLNVGSTDLDFKYFPNENLYISTDNSESVIVGIGRIPTSRTIRREIEMSRLMAYNFKNISELISANEYIYYLSNGNFINIFPKLKRNEYSYLKEFYKLDFFKEGLSKKDNNSIVWSNVYDDPTGRGSIVTVATPIEDRGRLRGLITLNLRSEFFRNDLEGKLMTEFFLLDKKDNVISYRDFENGEISKFYNRLPEKLYEKRYKFPDMKPGKMEKIGGYYVYFEEFSSVPWRVFYVTDTFKLHIQMLKKNVVFLSLWIFLVIILYEISRRKAFISDTGQAIEKLRGMLKKSDNEIEKDYTTGVFNRKGFIKISNFEISRMKRYSTDAAVMLMDIDHFKKFNDTYGHACGDYVLKEFVKTIMKNLRLIDVIGRWGGEEFLVLLPETDYKGALLAAEKLRKVIERQEFSYQKQPLKITVTIGVSSLSVIKTLDQSVEESDQAMYRGKETGRNRVVGYKELRDEV